MMSLKTSRFRCPYLPPILSTSQYFLYLVSQNSGLTPPRSPLKECNIIYGCSHWTIGSSIVVQLSFTSLLAISRIPNKINHRSNQANVFQFVTTKIIIIKCKLNRSRINCSRFSVNVLWLRGLKAL